MKNWKRLLALLLSGAMALSLFACTSGDDQPSDSLYPDAASTETASADPTLDPDPTPSIEVDLTQGPLEFSAGVSSTDVMLTVNGTGVPADLFLYMLAMSCGNMQAYLPYFGMTLSDVADTLLDESVDMAVYHVLIRQKAAELGCLPTDAQNADLQQAIIDNDLETIAPYWGLTDESAEFIIAMNTYYSNVLEATTHAPSDEELEQYISDKGVFAVKHILLKTTDDENNPLEDAVIAEKRSAAEDLLAQLQAAEDMSALFDELMRANSEDPGVTTNPDGYVFNADDSLVGGFREAALELDIGGLSGIVETDYGYHIMLRLPLTDETMDEYRQACRTDSFGPIVDQWLEETDVTRADSLTGLDVAGFYDRLVAYQMALGEQNAPEGEG